MFFRRMFTRKDNNNVNGDNDIDDDDDEDDVDELHENSNNHDNNNNNHNGSNGIQRHQHHHHQQQQQQQQRKYGAATAPATGTTTKHCNSATTLHRAATSGPSVVQLTPLWEHILRTRTLPDTICPVKMFGEFLERLRDPEWQVRQHALRVLVDVLVVMRAKADAFMEPLIPQLVENLGHQAPTVRKGALDCLRVYLAETAMPETILLQILDIGLNQKITNEPFGGRLTCGVMLSLPALVQSTLHTSKRHFILRTTIDMLVQKMGQVTHQEITLKVLLKIRELIGEREFVDYMTHGAYREFELLCNVYGVNAKSNAKGGSLSSVGNVAGSWRLLASQQRQQEQLSQSQIIQNCWRSSDEEQMLECASQAKVIMETEIKINDDTLTMRILEAKDEDCVETETDSLSPRKSQDSYPQSLEDEIVCGRLASAKANERDVGGVIRLLSDSELEESSPQDDDGSKQQNTEYFTVITPSTPSRTPKRVTFGGEVVKMRTPDSDATSSNNNQASNVNSNNSHHDISTHNQNSSDLASDSGGTNISPTESNNSISMPESKTTILNLDIPNDNTKPLPRSKTAQQSPTHEPQSQTQTQPLIAINQEKNSPATSSAFSNSPHSPAKRRDSNVSNSLASPKSPFKRISISPVDSIISPKAPHKATEMLHNLQRDPSPVRSRSGAAARRGNMREESVEEEILKPTVYSNQGIASERRKEASTPPPPKSWEDLNIVDYDTLLDLRSGDWRHRLQGIAQVAEALRSPENLALVQPCLDSLLRTLLSSERKHEVAEAKRQLLTNLISRLPLDNLEDRTVQIMTGLCRQGGAGSNRVCKALMHRLPAATIVLKLLSIEFLHAKSSRFREHALQMVMYALMTFPSTCYDTTTCVTNATYAALNRKRRVRQAALDVLAILGQLTTARTIMEVVQSVGATRDDGDALVAAVRARLLRKQLPLVTADGLVQYTLRVPSPLQQQQHSHDRDDVGGGGCANGLLGPDIEWITAGVGSVSPTSLKRRAQHHRSCSQQSFRCLPHHYASDVAAEMCGGGVSGGGMGSASGSNHSDESTSRRHSYRSPPETYGNAKDFSINDDTHSYNLQNMLGSSVPLHFGVASSKKSNVPQLSRRMVAKSCSDSSMDGRSSDSTYTNSSSGGGSGSGAAVAAGCVAANTGLSGISGRFTRQTVNSRFPAMDRMDLNATYMRVHKPPTYYPGMGAYAHLQQQQYNMSSTYPKINYTMPVSTSMQQQQQHRRRSHQHQQQPQHYIQPQKSSNYNVQENFKHKENLDKEQSNGVAKDSSGVADAGGSSENLDGTFTMHSDITSATAAAANAGVAASNDTTMGKASNSQQQQKQPQQQISNAGSNVRRFVNVDKFIMQSNKSSQTNGAATSEISSAAETAAVPTTAEPNTTESKQATPISMKSTTYSQKSTASAQSNGSRNNSSSANERRINESLTENAGENKGSTSKETMTTQNDQQQKEEKTTNYSSPATTHVGTLKEMANSNEVNSESPTKWTTGEELLDIEDIVDAVTKTAIMSVEADETSETLKRNGSVLSLQSKTESIKTQLEDTPPTLSRTQSNKSLVIEEDFIDDNGSFVVVEEVIEDLVEQQKNMTIRAEEELTADSKEEDDNYDQNSPVFDENFAKNLVTSKSRPPSRHHSPTIAELKTLSRRNSMIKSMESLYERPASKQDLSLDNTTTSSSTSTDSQASTQLKTIIPIKPQHTPLKQKSKTSHFLKNNNNRRRISPVKQAIKMTQAELYPSTLPRFEKPREALLKTFDQLDATSWEIIILGLKSMVRLMRYHPEHLENQMHMLCIQLARSVRNLRSQVARAACQAATELFTLKSKVMEQECDDLVCALLHRSADTNRFLRADATRALESMCDNLATSKVLNILATKGAQHQNAAVRTTAAKLLFRLVERLGCDKVFQMPRDNRDKFFITGANLLLEGSLETRGYAKSMFRLLSNHHNYNRLLLEVIPTRTYRNVEKALKSIQR